MLNPVRRLFFHSEVFASAVRVRKLKFSTEGIDQWQVGAFTPKPFGGNPAAVIFVQKDEQWMQNLAMENNLAETSFLAAHQDPNSYYLRWFTPNKEVDLCGHATLAAAHVIYQTNRVPRSEKISFYTKCSGKLVAVGKPDGSIQLDFPATPPKEETLSKDQMQTLLRALNVSQSDIVYVGRTAYDLFVELKHEAFASLNVTDFAAVETFGGRGIVTTSVGGARNNKSSSSAAAASSTHVTYDKRFDFLSRCFFPIFGINEDPVTGSAHCALAPYWFQKFNEKPDKTLVGYQASARGGIVNVSLSGDRVLLSGNCVTTIQSKVLV